MEKLYRRKEKKLKEHSPSSINLNLLYGRIIYSYPTPYADSNPTGQMVPVVQVLGSVVSVV